MEDKYVAVLLENIRSDFRAFGEGLQLVNQRIDETNRRLDETNRKLERLTQEFVSFRDETRRNTDALYGILTRLTEITERHDTDIDSLKLRVERLEKKAG